MKIKLYLKNPPKTKRGTGDYDRNDPRYKKETAIYALCHLGHKDDRGKYVVAKIYSKYSIEPRYWNPKEGRARQTNLFEEHPEFNQNLKSFESELNATYLELKEYNKFPSSEEYRNAWSERNQPKEKPDNNFVLFAEKHIANIEGKVAASTIKSFKNSLRHIKEFAERTNANLAIDTIGFDFHYSLIEHLKTEKSFGTNTIWRINKFLRYILRYANEKGLNVRPDYQSQRFSVKPFEPDVVYLNENELHKIYATTIKDKKLERVKDLFLIGCYTGLRFSDFNRLNPDNIKEIDGKQYLRITTQKTNDPVFIPLHPIVTEIIDKYAGLPKGMSNQKFNEYIKKVAEIAEIKTPVSVEEMRGKMKFHSTKPKYKVVTSHTARRSFATNAYKAEVPIPSLMLITGHRTETAFLRYIRISKEENAVLMAKHPFFNTPNLKIAK